MPNHVYIATSLDGFIADADGGLDAVVMGRGTFETALTFGAWPHAEFPRGLG